MKNIKNKNTKIIKYQNYKIPKIEIAKITNF